MFFSHLDILPNPARRAYKPDFKAQRHVRIPSGRGSWMRLNAPGPSPELQVNQAGNERPSWKGHSALDSGSSVLLLVFLFFFYFYPKLGPFELAVAALMTRRVVVVSALWCDSCLEEFCCWLWCRGIYLGPA